MDMFHLADGDGGGKLLAARSSVRNSPSWVLLVGAAVALVLLTMVYNPTRRKHLNLPPGPRNWPVIGAMLDIKPPTYLVYAKLAKKHGPILYFRLGVQPVVVVSSAQGEKIKANGTHYSLLTFSGGRRGCAGFNLAWVLLLRATATLVHAFDWSPPPGVSPNDISAEEEAHHVVLKPIVDLFLTPKPRVSYNLYHSKVLT